ncbi:MAG: SDR family oxidoreductase [Methylovulum sp.]|uniref:UDP-glucose 4-epimerase family protein n=1 Tax=Methylovulum sp. TaxID=1916980 RepID=UPI0026348CDC|nr:SDR family oxidoreductase [Methylovulum sp.]MDD2723479.1 SDR family oxidoreductase [Methylovulum sp.]MDD5123903.1 SDR family oxidoreductase [Methylovulum sp.]
MDNVLVTGAAGFVGKALCVELIAKNFNVTEVTRLSGVLDCQVGRIGIEGIDGHTDWHTALKNIEVVVHLAARVHVLHETAVDALAEFRKVNVEGTLNLARQAADAGVKRFVFISTIKVNGENTLPGHAFTADDEPNPVDFYAISKREAEDGLRQLALVSDMEVVVIRPPLVYGAGVKANFQAMMQYLDKGLPLPLGLLANKRSLVALDNLVDVIMLCMTHPAAANQTFLVSDGEDLSTTELLHRLAYAMGKKARLLPVPVNLLKGALFLWGKGAMVQRLCGNLQVDDAKTRQLLAWAPRVDVDLALSQTVQHYLASH